MMIKRAQAGATKREAQTRSETVYRLLRRAILEQALRPGTRLPEDLVGEQVGVSRTIVRTALTRLSAEGLVDLRPNRGAVVAEPSLEEARQVFTVRGWLERAVVAELAQAVTQRQLALLEEHVEREQKAKGRDGPRSIRLAGEFHVLLAELTGNRHLIRYVNETVSRCSLILALYAVKHSTDCAVSEHRAIIAALRRRDGAAAERLMLEHLGGIAERAELLPTSQAPDLKDVLARYVEPAA
jgi:DNA-binding GntR family transcriptional regulator